MIRTTVRLDEDTFKNARKKAIDEGVAFTDIVSQALKVYLKDYKQRKPLKQKFELKVYNIGPIKGSLSREEIYEDI